MLTLQQVFDRAARHLILQNARSVSNPHTLAQSCAYRGPGRLMCAVGVLIDDAHYHRDLEGVNVLDLGVQRALEASGVSLRTPEGNSKKEVPLLAYLQQIHDEAPVDSWPERLATLAHDYELDDAIIQTSIHERDLRIQEAANAL